MNLTNIYLDQACFIQQLFQNWEGKWLLKRNLNNQATMQGIASFTQVYQTETYNYEEKGKVYLKYSCFNAYRHYQYSLQNNQILLHLVDLLTKKQSNLLYVLHFISPSRSLYPLHAYGTYHCRADIYRAYYQFINHQAFQLTYQVTGPLKKWTVQTYFSKLPTN